MEYTKRGKNTKIEKHNTGKSPNKTLLNKARDNFLHHTTYNRQRELLNYSGTPDLKTRGASSFQINGAYSCNFYIIYPTRGKGSDTVRLGFDMTTWDNNDLAGNCNFKWDGAASERLSAAEIDVVNYKQYDTSEMNPEDKPEGASFTDFVKLDYDNNDFGGYSFTKVSFEHLQPASFVSWIMPIKESEYNEIDPDTTDGQAYSLGNSMFNLGQSIRGSNALNDGNGSIGTLCQRQFNDGTGDSNMTANSDLCLFQWGHPAGIVVDGGGSGTLNDQNVFDYDVKIKGRELLSSGSGKFDVAMIYRADAGTKIKIYVDSTATTHTYDLTTSDPVIKEVVLTDIPFDGSGDDLTITCYASDTLLVEIKTIAIFESTY